MKITEKNGLIEFTKQSIVEEKPLSQVSHNYLTNMTKNYKSEYFFPLMLRIPAITLMICGLFLIFTFSSKSRLGLIITLLALPFVFTRRGTLLDFSNYNLKYYIGLLNLKIGKWIKIKSYPYITILHLNLVASGESASGLVFSDRTKVYRICLLNENHREKLKIIDFKDIEVAKLEAEKLAHNLGCKLVSYSPK